MNSTAAPRLVLPLGLLLLALCSSGLALTCYSCNWSTGECQATQVCASGQDACIKITQDVGQTRYGCTTYSRCNTNNVNVDYQLSSNYELRCCQNNLCNKGIAGLPASGLILFLAAALLLFFS